MKNRACIGWTSGFRECLARSLPAKKTCEKHMLEAKESCQAVSFVSVSQEGPARKIPTKLSTWRILSVTFLPFTHTIYTFINHKSIKGYSERKTLDRFYNTTQHTHLLKRKLLILNKKIIVASSTSLSHCHTLRGDLYPNTTHTFSKCRECFGAWEVLEICLKKPMRLGGCNRVYCKIQKVRKDMTPKNPLVAGAWRAQVNGVD